MIFFPTKEEEGENESKVTLGDLIKQINDIETIYVCLFRESFALHSMKHRVNFRKLGRKTSHRIAMLKCVFCYFDKP